MKKLILLITIGLVITAFCAAQTQPPESGSYKKEGKASWYGQEYQGRPTASGEPFDPNQFTAAHPDLPFGTILTITNLANNKQVNVRVNDRGPFVKSRIIDVSKAAAERLDMLSSGTADVLVEIAPRGVGESMSVPTTTQIAPAAPANTAPALMPIPAQTASTQPPTAPANPRNNAAAQAAATGRLPSPTQPSVQPQPRQPTTRVNPPAQTTAETQPAQQTPRIPTTQQPQQPRTTGTPAYTPQQPAVTPQTTTAPATETAAGQIRPVQTGNRIPAPQDQVEMPKNAAISPINTVSTPAAEHTIVKSPPPYFPTAQFSGATPKAGKTYRLQVGSYKVARNAVEAFDRLVDAGFSPKWEPYGELYRVVIPNVRAEDLNELAKKLGNAGFGTALVREEG